MIAHYYSELVGFFSKTVGDRESAEDVAQEAFARVLAMHAGGAAILDPRALLYRAGKNLVVSGARRKQAEQRMLRTLALVSAESAPSVEQQVDARLRLESLIARLAAMPRKRREAFILVRIYGYSYSQAAEHMKLSSQAVERHVVRGVFDCMRHRSA